MYMYIYTYPCPLWLKSFGLKSYCLRYQVQAKRGLMVFLTATAPRFSGQRLLILNLLPCLGVGSLNAPAITSAAAPRSLDNSNNGNASVPVKMGGDAWGLDDAKSDGSTAHNCRHGVWDNSSRECKCFDGWATAGMTDTLDFLEGVCEQYRCVDDTTCQNVLNTS